MKAIAPTSSALEPGAFPAPRTERGVAAKPQKEAAAHQSADLRLVIEEDEATGRFIYKTLDRRTGEVVQQLPREDVLRLKDEPGYSPGDITDSTS